MSWLLSPLLFRKSGSKIVNAEYTKNSLTLSQQIFKPKKSQGLSHPRIGFSEGMTSSPHCPFKWREKGAKTIHYPPCSLHSRRGLVQEDKRTVFAYTHGLFIT
jgi:hypothetical protein